ncbi:hypothetical protein B0H13DRAFT_1880580 [Mycena leptocephala]|nr:hypothetical protein B0H13DRAFT_1880580 [Mycena leptocephala]
MVQGYGYLVKELKSCAELEIPFHKAVKVTGADIETELRKLFPNSILGHDSSTAEWIVKLMPSGAHDVAADLLMWEIIDQYRVANNTNMSAVCYSSGTQSSSKASVPSYPTRNKQANQSFCSVARPANSPPVVVVEVGVSESRTRLVDDARWWLESGHVNLVILIIIRKSAPQSLHVELWERQLNPRPPRTVAARLWVPLTRVICGSSPASHRGAVRGRC